VGSRLSRKTKTRRPDLLPGSWRRPAITAVVVLALATAVAFERLGFFSRSGDTQPPAASSTASDHDRYHNRTFTCVKVVDGDTIDIDPPDGKYPHTRIRLWGVDTPETDKSTKGAMYFGTEASAFTRSLVDGKQVRVVLAREKTRDRYGRLLAYVYLPDGDTMLNEEIIARGYGYADTRFAHDWKKRFVDLEQRARRQKLGLWKDVTPDRMPSWRQHDEERHTGAAGRGER
jgi:endonuclease YncB( thermonuclease family)